MIFITEPTKDYELLDSGEGEKLERFGSYILARPDPQALWHKTRPAEEWQNAHGIFDVKARATAQAWTFKPDVPQKWSITHGGVSFWIQPSNFKHTGIFPEQAPNWQWITDSITQSRRANVKVLNLFGYTGGATLAASKAGAVVVHVDGSKVAIKNARENAELTGVASNPIRWILDDVMVFVKREVSRGNTYDGIIMDPPAFGRGPEGEVWKIEDDFLKLVDLCGKILSSVPLFFLINGYAAGYSPLAYHSILSDLMATHGHGTAGTVESGELAIRESASGRTLPAGITARWSAKP
jgi:23S rRNA (cytosine1962-C5)-methyltransferase